MQKHLKAVLSVTFFTMMLSGCASIKNMKMPSFSLPHMPEAHEMPENVGDYPSIVDAPPNPTELRTDAQWDTAAKSMLMKRDSFALPGNTESVKSEAEILRNMQALKAKVDEYKLDDPQ